jgi:hypothetical protein
MVVARERNSCLEQILFVAAPVGPVQLGPSSVSQCVLDHNGARARPPMCCQQVLVLLLLAAQVSGDSIPVQAAVRWVYPRFQTSVLGYQPGNWFLATPSMEIHSQWTALTRHDAQVT